MPLSSFQMNKAQIRRHSESVNISNDKTAHYKIHYSVKEGIFPKIYDKMFTYYSTM